MLIAIVWFSSDISGWATTVSVLTSVIASVIFSALSAMLLRYYFVDTEHAETSARVIPQDISTTLRRIAEDSDSYSIYVRTGRHFRAEILPQLVRNAVAKSRTLSLEIILLDFRNIKTCTRYAEYRANASFDRDKWNCRYVQEEIVATILKVNELAIENRAIMKVSLYLTSRLSFFRIEGSPQEILVTREDPKDMAAYYPRNDSYHVAFMRELEWVKIDDSTERMDLNFDAAQFRETFREVESIEDVLEGAASKIGNASPYVR